MRQDSRRIRQIASAIMLGTAALLIVLTVLFSFDKKEITVYRAAGHLAQVKPIETLSPDSLLNSGDLQALDALPGIGEVLAQRIIEFREQYGPYLIPEAVMGVKGIGTKKMMAIRDYLAQWEAGDTGLPTD